MSCEKAVLLFQAHANYGTSSIDFDIYLDYVGQRQLVFIVYTKQCLHWYPLFLLNCRLHSLPNILPLQKRVKSLEKKAEDIFM